MMADLHHLLAIYVHAHQTGNSVPPHIDAEARTALAEPKRPPNDLEIDALVHDCLEEDGYSLRVIIRAALARYGYRPLDSSPPADGEVAELVAELQSMATDADRRCRFSNAERLSRAAELLQRQALVPVSVSERLPGAEETTEDGEVWIEDPGHDYPLADTGDYDWEPHRWVLRRIGKFDAKNNLHWLPAHALPLPEVGE